MENVKQTSTLQIYNTLKHGIDAVMEEDIGMYVCGPTVYDVPHIGHARSAYIFDMLSLKQRKL